MPDPADAEAFDAFAARWSLPMSHWMSPGVPGPESHVEAAHFIDHHLKHGSTFKRWDAAWRTWLKNAPKFAGRANGKTWVQPAGGTWEGRAKA